MAGGRLSHGMAPMKHGFFWRGVDRASVKICESVARKICAEPTAMDCGCFLPPAHFAEHDGAAGGYGRLGGYRSIVAFGSAAANASICAFVRPVQPLRSITRSAVSPLSPSTSVSPVQ